MAKLNALVIESGDLLEKPAVLLWLKQQQKKYHVTLFTGAGKQINKASLEAGYKRKFCPMGRVPENASHRQLCERIARDVQALVQDQFDQHSITCRVLPPIDTADDVVVPLNGDVAMFSKYLGYDVTFRLTEKSRVNEKKLLIQNAAKAFAPIAGLDGVDLDLNKIRVIGF